MTDNWTYLPMKGCWRVRMDFNKKVQQRKYRQGINKTDWFTVPFEPKLAAEYFWEIHKEKLLEEIDNIGSND